MIDNTFAVKIFHLLFGVNAQNFIVPDETSADIAPPATISANIAITVITKLGANDSNIILAFIVVE